MNPVDEADEKRAIFLIHRLNCLIKTNPAVAPALKLLIENRIELPDRDLLNHPTIQVGSVDRKDEDGPIEVGFLGMLNGIVGTVPDGERKGWGWITAVIEDDGKLSKFVKTIGPGEPGIMRESTDDETEV